MTCAELTKLNDRLYRNYHRFANIAFPHSTRRSRATGLPYVVKPSTQYDQWLMWLFAHEARQTSKLWRQAWDRSVAARQQKLDL